MKQYVRKQYILEELELLPKRESIRGNIKAYQNYWDYLEKPHHTRRKQWRVVNRIVDKCIGKHISYLVRKLTNNIKYKKCYEFKMTADMFIEQALTDYNPLDSKWKNVANLDGILVYPYTLEERIPYKHISIYFKFIKWFKKYESTLQCYVIVNDVYYRATADFKNIWQLPFAQHCRVQDVKNLIPLSYDEILDLKDYINGIE